ncbi:MAG TPA: hypothetical protein VFV75_11360 [Candidatus Polarisedimenticolaceae bacterium]|nr:hypothetical protein [Candidatus Polarisedimenticolaceae bacterium]
MRKTPWMVAACFAATAGLAQGEAGVRQQLATDRATIQADRQAIVAEALPLTEEQAKAFWPLFREYRGEMEKLGDRAVDLMIDYAKNMDVLTDEKAAALLDEYLKIQRDEVKVKQSWLPRFRKVLPGKTVTRFYQIESKLDTLLRFEAAAQIPLVEDLNVKE